MTEEMKGDESREKKMARIDFLVSRKNFIVKFLERASEDVMGLNNDVLTQKQIKETFELKTKEDFIAFMENHSDLWDTLNVEEKYSERQCFGIIPVERRNQMLTEIDRELKTLYDTAGKNDANNIGVVSANNSEIHLLTHDLKQIHPVQDFFEGKAYTCVILPYTEKIDKGNGLFVEEMRNGKFLINSNREKPILLNKALMKKGIGNNVFLKVFPEFLDARWERKSIIDFLNNNNPHYTFEEIFNEVRDHIKYYVELEDENQYSIVACWIVMTYFFEMFDSFGYLYLTGTKRVGKTKLLKIIATLAFNGKLNIGIKTASLFRSIHNSKLTLCLDEIDANTLKNDTDLNEVLRGGYIKGHSVPRTERNEKTGAFEVKQHEFYSPKALCNITGIDDVIEDRAITIVMVRSSNPVVSMRDVNMNDQKWKDTRNKLYVFMMECFGDIEKLKESIDKTKMSFIDMISDVSGVSVAKLGKEKEVELVEMGVFEDKMKFTSKNFDKGELVELFDSPEVYREKGNGVKDLDDKKKNISVPVLLSNNSTNSTNTNNNNNTYNTDITQIEEGSTRGSQKSEGNDYFDNRHISTTPLDEDDDSDDSGVSGVKATMKNITQRNYQISQPILAFAYGTSQKIFDGIVECLANTFERKKQSENNESNDNSLVEVLVCMIDARRWWKTSSIADAMKVSTEEQWANPRWVGRALNRIFPKVERRKMPQGNEVLLSPKMVRSRAEKIGLDVEQIIAYSKYNPLTGMNDIEKIKFKLKNDREIIDFELVKWAVEQGIVENKAEQIIQKLINDGYIMSARSGFYRWAV